MTISSLKVSRKITAAEVQEWAGKSSKVKLGQAQCSEIAAGLTRLRWPGDPPAVPGSPWLTKEPEPEPDRWWDFEAATEAAKLLNHSIPRMLSHWEGLRWAPETRGGYDAIKTLGEALSTAMPYVEWPLGYYEGQRRTTQPKPWHMMAVLIANLVIKVMVKAGNSEPGITRNSVVVRIVRHALIRMHFANSRMITLAAILRQRMQALSRGVQVATCDAGIPQSARCAAESATKKGFRTRSGCAK